MQSCVAQGRQITLVIDVCNELEHTGCKHCLNCTGDGDAKVEQVDLLLSNPSACALVDERGLVQNKGKYRSIVS